MKRLSLTLTLVLWALSAGAQGINNVRINEVLVRNVDNFVDDYGHRSSWIELFNAGYEKVNVGGCYLEVTDTDGSQVRYAIPRNDSRTQMDPHGYLVFFCEGTGTKGTFYTNFTLDDARSIEFLNANGRDVLDKVEFSMAEQLPDISIGIVDRPEGPVLAVLDSTTPGAPNGSLDEIPQHERFRRMDPSGVVMMLTAMFVVFSALVLLFAVFKLFGRYMVALTNRKAAVSTESGDAAVRSRTEGYSGEVVAAIGLALQMYRSDLHDRESTVITINRVARVYSPWSSKIYGLRQLPNKSSK